ncbi:MAG: hypothetical protein V9E91_04585 [Burkholderiaceae bacterium]|jgi:superfamily I DNA/RNA helicase
MSDFAKTIIGVLVGGLITLGANVFLWNITTQKEKKAELRGKLESLYEHHLSDFNCYALFLRDGKETDKCEESKHDLKAFGLANLYFSQEINDALSRFAASRDAGKSARLQCNIKYPNQAQYTEQLKCAIDVASKFKISAADEAGNIAAVINKQAKSLRAD